MTDIEKLHAEMVTRLVKSGSKVLDSLTPSKCNLWHAATGVAGEAGELIDAVKRHIIHERPIDRQNVVEELGDLEFYMQQMREELGITRWECLEFNHRKLVDKDKGRYSTGSYSDQQAADRLDKQPDEQDKTK